MQRKPVIGISPNYSYETKEYSLHEDYVLAIEKAGGFPLLLLPHQGLPDFLDGLLLTGGGDIDPLLFGEEPLLQNGEINPLRDAYEIKLCQEAFFRNLPMLGICRGMQVMNIVTGGKIYQDIYVQTDTTLKHTQQAPRFYGTHSIFLEEHSLLASLWESQQTIVNTLHHQSCSTPGKGFKVIAKSADGLIEAIAHENCAFAVGVQWHPEAMKTEEMELLFSAFLKAAADHKTNRRD